MSTRSSSAQIGLKANVKIYGLPKDFTYSDFQKLNESQKKKLLVDEGKNLVVDAGMNYIIGLMNASNSGSFTHCAAGSNNTAVTSGDTALNTQIGSRVTVTYRYSTSLNAKFDTFFSTTDANGTWAETGLFTASSGGTMLCRKILSSTFVKSTSNTAVIAWTITFSAS